MGITVRGLERPYPLRVASGEIEELREVQIRYRTDWPAVFSCNKYGEIWVFSTYGYTRSSRRVRIIGNRLLEKIVGIYLQRRPEGGRFFVDESGVYIRPEDGFVQIISFVQRNIKRSTPEGLTESMRSIRQMLRHREVQARRQFGHLWDQD